MTAWRQALAILREVDVAFSPFRADSYVCRLDRAEIDLSDCPPEVSEVLAIGEHAKRDSGGAFDVFRNGHLDPSGVVKGWAVERAAVPLRRVSGIDFCLSAGGDLVAHVARTTAEPWRIGIEDPRDPSRILAVIPVRRGAVATSGLAHRGDHIRHGRTGKVPRALASVTVVAEDLTTADVDATAAFALDEVGPTWLRQRGRCGIVVHADGRCDQINGVA